MFTTWSEIRSVRGGRRPNSVSRTETRSGGPTSNKQPLIRFRSEKIDVRGLIDPWICANPAGQIIRRFHSINEK